MVQCLAHDLKVVSLILAHSSCFLTIIELNDLQLPSLEGLFNHLFFS